MNQPSAFNPLQQAKVLKVIWLGMLAAILVYLFVGWMMAQTMVPGERSVLANLVWLFGASFVAMGFLLPKILFKNLGNPTQYTQGLIIRWAMFESLAILSLVNFISQGVSFVEFAIGITVAFTLVLVSKPKLATA